jgi:hypothetical protein
MDGKYSACSRKVLTTTSRKIKATLSCRGGKVTGTIDLTSAAQSVEGQIVFVAHEPAYDRIETRQVKGERIASVCDAGPSK